MNITIKAGWLFLLFISSLRMVSQHEGKKWYFGSGAALDFMTTPPTALLNSNMISSEACASVADASGNLLFYTNGLKVWDQNNAVMANGTGLDGHQSTAQGATIVKQPGSPNLYYIFTLAQMGGALKYSVVDMSLAAGSGSVITKNTLLSLSCLEKLTVVKNCNGVNYWIIAHTTGSDFQAFELTTSGINPAPVVSTVGPAPTSNAGLWGCLKISPNNKKLMMAFDDAFHLYDFDPATGIVSNFNLLVSGPAYNGAYGCEFSPDGTKIYGGSMFTGKLFQWNLCAGPTMAAVASSEFSMIINPFGQTGNIKLGPDGKIYISRVSSGGLDVINNPNAAGSAFNYVAGGVSTLPNQPIHGLPNNPMDLIQPTPVYTHTNTINGCQVASFNSGLAGSTFTAPCSPASNVITAVSWNFGDPASGSLNTSTLTLPSHTFSAGGTFTVKLMYHYNCYTDTVLQILNVPPCTSISVSSSSVSCLPTGSASVSITGGQGPFTYSWMPVGQTSSVATGLGAGSYSVSVFDTGTSQTYTAATTLTSAVSFSANLNYAGTLSCAGVNTGTAGFSNITGGPANKFYNWSGAGATQTTSVATGLAAGNYTGTVTDGLTGCSYTQTFSVLSPPQTLMVTAPSLSACVGAGVTLTGTNTGTGPSYTYLWSNGVNGTTQTVSEQVPGLYVYTLTSLSSNNCSASNTIGISFSNPPVLTVTHVTVCPQQAVTLNASGAASYTWTGNITGSTFNVTASLTTAYQVIGSAAGCTVSATASVSVKPIPAIAFVSNSPVCAGQAITFSATGNGVNYVWTGPQGFISALPSNTISNASVFNGGLYQFTATAANSCTVVMSGSIAVNQLPVVTAVGSTVCATDTLHLSAFSPNAAAYLWTGPSFSSTQQHPVISHPPVSASGAYAVKVTSVPGCTSQAVAQASVMAVQQPTASNNGPVCAGALLLLSAGTGDFYNWAGPGSFAGNNASIAINASLSSAGIYTVKVTSGLCVASATTQVVVHGLPVVLAGNNTQGMVVCPGGTLTLKANGTGLSYSWSGPFNFHASVQEPAPVFPVSSSHNGAYTVQVTDANGCLDTSITVVTISPAPVIGLLSASVCLNTPAILTATGASSYHWLGPNGFTGAGPSVTLTNFSHSSAGIYTISGTANTCTGIATAQLSVLDPPVASIATGKAALCVNELISLEGSGGDSYEWRGPAGFSGSGKQVTLRPFHAGYSGNYTLTVTGLNGCRQSAVKDLVIKELPYASLRGSLAGCIPFCSGYTVVPSRLTNPAVVARWAVDGKEMSGRSFSYCFNEAKQYEITTNLYDSLSTCANTQTFMVEGFQPPVAGFEILPENPVENSDAVRFINTSDAEVRTEWYLANKQVFSVERDLSHLFSDAGTYPVAIHATDTHGCSTSLVRSITVEEDFSIYVPNVFTPNDDQRNDTFFPVMRGVKKYSLLIFDRWGEQIFETTDPYTGWDGTFKDKDCQYGVYVWKLNVTSNRGKIKEMAGYVTLYR